MSIINNAHPGSQINLLCIIYRVIYRNNGKLSIKDLSTLCRPENLPTLPDHQKRFSDNLQFWMNKSHQLWRENEDSKLELTVVSASESPEDIARATSKALFSTNINDIFGRDSHKTEQLFRTLGFVLATDQFLATSETPLDNNGLDDLFGRFLPDSVPNNSEKGGLFSYGHFLGFLEPVSAGKYLVDPTHAINNVLPHLFEDGPTLNVDKFIQHLAELVPLLDGGRYRRQIEGQMTGGVTTDLNNRRLSKNLSLALERLRLSGTLSFEPKSDDPKEYRLQLRDMERSVSVVQYEKYGGKR